MLTVTQKQRENAHELLRMLATIPPENVHLEQFREDGSAAAPNCGTIACIGGWVAWWPAFRAQGVYASKQACGAPRSKFLPDKHSSGDVAQELFGDRRLFMVGDNAGHEEAVARVRALISETRVVR